MLCAIATGLGLASFFVLRDFFRFAREGIPLSWLAAIGTLFTGIVCVIGGTSGLVVALCLVAAYLLGRLAAKQPADGNDT